MKIFSIIGCVLITSSLFLLIYVIVKMLLPVNSITSEAATIFGGGMSLIGGAAGAMGAYMAARHQINKGKNQESIKLLSFELPIFISLTLEFENIISHLQRVEEFKKKNEWVINSAHSLKRTNFFRELTIELDSIKWDRWIDIKKITDSILLKELLFFEESFKRITEVLEYDIYKQDKKVWPLLTINNDEAIELINEIKIRANEKEEYLNEVYYCLQKAEKIQKVVLNKISTIEKLIEGKNTIENYQFFSSQDFFKIERDDGENKSIKVTSN